MVERKRQKIKDTGRAINAIAKTLRNPLAGSAQVLNMLDALAPLFPGIPLIDTSPFGDEIENLPNKRDDAIPETAENKFSEDEAALNKNKSHKTGLVNSPSTSFGKEPGIAAPVFPLGKGQIIKQKNTLINQNEKQQVPENHPKTRVDDERGATPPLNVTLGSKVSQLSDPANSDLRPKTGNALNPTAIKEYTRKKMAANSAQFNSTAAPFFSGLPTVESAKSKSTEKNSIELIDALADRLLLPSNHTSSTSEKFYNNAAAESENNSREPELPSTLNLPKNLKPGDLQTVMDSNSKPANEGIDFKGVRRGNQFKISQWNANDIASLVNDALTEQARRHGVDLS